MPTGMEGPKMSKREELRAEVKTDREQKEAAHKLAADRTALMAKVAELRAQAPKHEAQLRTTGTPAFEITPKMRAEAAARAEADRKRLPDN